MHTPWSHSAVARWHLQMVHISLKSCAHLSQAVRFSHSHQWGLVENYYATIARYHSCMVLMPITYQFLGWLVVGTTPKIYSEHQLVGWSDLRHWCTDWIETLVCEYTPNHEADGSMIDITICYILYMCSKHTSCVVPDFPIQAPIQDGHHTQKCHRVMQNQWCESLSHLRRYSLKLTEVQNTSPACSKFSCHPQ